jgi:glycerol-3-phosphate cytidylyltransferase-like family protein
MAQYTIVTMFRERGVVDAVMAEHEKTITDTVRRTEVDVVNTGTEIASDRIAGTERIERTRTDT